MLGRVGVLNTFLEAPGWLSWLGIRLLFQFGYDLRVERSSPSTWFHTGHGACLQFSLPGHLGGSVGSASAFGSGHDA